MPNSAIVSFRTQTNDSIRKLLRDEGLACAQSQGLLSYFAGALLNYKEEGVEFLPSIILCGSVRNFLTTFPGSVHHIIGSAPLSPFLGPKILKECAPLSSSNWFIFIERDEQNSSVKYGVFTYFKTPTAIPLHEGISINPDQLCILIRKTSTNTIDIRGSKGHLLTLLFSTLREVENTTKRISSFAKRCCSGIENAALKDEFSNYFFNLLERSLSSCHGTILVCANELDYDAVPALQDAVHVEPIIDFLQIFTDFKQENSADSILSLQRCEELLQGFLRCDGIIVVDCSGGISAYRVFYKPSIESPEDASQVVGGARRRAFEGIKEFVGEQLDSVLFRSQDGQTLFCGEPS